MRTKRFKVQTADTIYNKAVLSIIPNNDECLDFIFAYKNQEGVTCAKCGRSGCFYRVKRRKCYSCAHCGHQISPTEGTIFHKSRTPLRHWFFAVYLIYNPTIEFSCKELERQIGVTYKCAHRMAKQIRGIMDDSGMAYNIFKQCELEIENSIEFTTTASEFEAAMKRASHTPEECQKVTEAHLAKLDKFTLPLPPKPSPTGCPEPMGKVKEGVE